ncbi:MAG: NAD-dependent epimerase/dehydratase family protein [Elusimicrobia bacterium]|nr:NAD-dependent epimerase/dehydratase family protein [Elusimicrobiota bacterium]
MGFWERKRVLVAGGAGFIGSHVVEELLKRGSRVSVADHMSAGRRANLKAVRRELRFIETDFLSPAQCRKACAGQEIVLNLAAKVAGVGFNSQHHGTMFRENILIAAHVMEAAREAGVGRFLVVSSACVYPHDCGVPTLEEDGARDAPEPASEGYGWAKRMAEFLGTAYQREFGMKVAIARPANAYGPRDHFDTPAAHVVASLIRRAVRGEDPVTVWGNGTPKRNFLFVEDIARGLLDVAERYPAADPVNLGSDEEVSIRELAELILELSGSSSRLTFDRSKPAGQPRRYCSTEKAKKTVGFSARIPLREGLSRTISWYRQTLVRSGRRERRSGA